MIHSMQDAGSNGRDTIILMVHPLEATKERGNIDKELKRWRKKGLDEKGIKYTYMLNKEYRWISVNP